MLGVNIKGPATMLGDNMSVVLNTTVPSSSLKKKCNAIAYHRVREAIAENTINIAKSIQKTTLLMFVLKH